MYKITIIATESELDFILESDIVTTARLKHNIYKELGYDTSLSDGIFRLSRREIHNNDEEVLIRRIINTLKLCNALYEFV